MERNPKVARGNYAFIDSQNVNVSTQKFGWKMNWRELRQIANEHIGFGNVVIFR